MRDTAAPSASGLPNEANPATPRISVGIPTYNRETLVGGAIESALKYGGNDLEVIVIDNASEDRTVEVAQSYAQRDPRVRVVVNDRNLGLFGNFNRCLELARGAYVCVLCSDDRVRPGFLEEASRVMDANPDCGLLTTPAQIIDEHGRPLRLQSNHLQPGVYSGRDAIYLYVWFHAHYAFPIFNVPSGMLIRKAAIEGIPHFPTHMKIVGDAEFFTRVLETSNLAVMDRVGCEHMYHPGQEVFKIYDDPARIFEHYEILERYRDVLGRDFRRCLAAEGAVNTALGVKFSRMGWKPTAQAHFDAVRSKGIPWPMRQWALARLVLYRALFKAFGLRFVPKRPIRPLMEAA